jgi:nucleotide-binding universal stress UspA family protein
MEKEGQEKKARQRKPKILVPIDASEISDLVVKRTGQFIKLTGYEFDLTILHVVEDVAHFEDVPKTPVYEEKVKKSQAVLEKAQRDLKGHGIDCDTKMTIGPIAAEVLRVAEEGKYNGIWIGSRGYGGIKRMLLGSVADNVIRHAHCSVVVVR